MPGGNSSPTTFGPGGKVPVEDQELITAIKNTKELPLSALVKLVVFYQDSVLNKSLGNRLTCFALLKVLTQPDVKAAVLKAFPDLAPSEWDDMVEDLDTIFGPDETIEDPKDNPPDFKIVSFGPVNLLIEIDTLKDVGGELYFIIGIAPK